MELVAYVVSEDGQKLGGAELRRHLLESLPEYMVPSSFVDARRLPLTPNGKVDRKAFPSPPSTIPPRRDLSYRRVARLKRASPQLWSELLGRPRVGVEDNFFEIGGHSLLATQILARVRDMYRGGGLAARFLGAADSGMAVAACRAEMARGGRSTNAPDHARAARTGSCAGIVRPAAALVPRSA